MNRAEARKIAKSKWGPTANCVNVSSRDRNQRFGIVMFDTTDNKLYVLGYGDSYQSALKMAEENPVAVAFNEINEKAKTDFLEFLKDSEGYIEREKAKLEKLIKET